MNEKRHLSLAFKLGGTMVVVIVVAMAMATGLNLLRFEETYKRIIAQRLEVTAREVAQSVTTGLDLGLHVENQGNLPALIAKVETSQPDLVVAIHDCKGGVVIGDTARADHPWKAFLGDAQWSVFDPSRVGFGVMVRDNLGKCAAGVAVEMPSGAFERVVRTVSSWFWSVAGLATLAACLMAVGSAMFFNRRSRAINLLERDLSTVVAGEPPESDQDLSPTRFPDPWERAVAECYVEARRKMVDRVDKNGETRS